MSNREGPGLGMADGKLGQRLKQEAWGQLRLRFGEQD